jgi:hypothetical protein
MWDKMTGLSYKAVDVNSNRSGYAHRTPRCLMAAVSVWRTVV